MHKKANVRLPRSIKLTDEELLLMQRAAAMVGLHYSAFMRSAIVQASRSILAQFSTADANTVGLPAFKLDFSRLRPLPESEATTTNERPV